MIHFLYTSQARQVKIQFYDDVPHQKAIPCGTERSVVPFVVNTQTPPSTADIAAAMYSILSRSACTEYGPGKAWIPLRLGLAGQGTHTAMKSGMLAAEAAFDALTETAPSSAPADLAPYEAALKSSWVWEELEGERNIRPACAAPDPVSPGKPCC